MLKVDEALNILRSRSDLVKRLEGETRQKHVMMFETVAAGRQLGFWLSPPRGRNNGVRIKLEHIPADITEIEKIDCAKSDGLSKPSSKIPNGKGVCVFVSDEEALVKLLQSYNGNTKNVASVHPTQVSALDVSSDKTSRDSWRSEFSEPQDEDLPRLQLFARKLRRGQASFRNMLLELYDRRCAVSGQGLPVVLEAAHIWEHAASGINHSSNGLLLRADIHILFDEGLLRIHPESLLIEVASELRGSEYEILASKKLRERKDGSRPSSEFLAKRYQADN